jgi:putrescine transport system permease protein
MPGQTLRHWRALCLADGVFLLPFLILLYISFVDMGNDIHPFKPIWDPQTGMLQPEVRKLLDHLPRRRGTVHCSRRIYIEAYLRSIWYAFGRPCCVC